MNIKKTTDMEDKITTTRNYILNLMESGKLKGGDKIPGARDIASSINVSFLIVQQTMSILANEGILETVSHSRHGTFVQQNWETRVLQTNFSMFRNLPWQEDFKPLLSYRIPELRVCTKFPRSVFELRTTLDVQRNRNDYLDLRLVFDRLYQDKSLFFSHPFKNFYIDHKLVGIPFVFSPRVIFYNPELLKKYGCKEPQSGWMWDDFLQSIRKMRTQNVPGAEIFNWYPSISQWINIVFRSGGCLISSSLSDPVALDHPGTRHGLRLYTDLMHELNITYDETLSGNFIERFIGGELAFMLSAREALTDFKKAGFDCWKTVPLPLISGGADITAQATDLICIRKNCTDMAMAEDFVRFMLSEESQDFIGAQKYGIPIRKSSAFKSIDQESPRDMLFLSETNKISAQYNINSPEISSLIEEGIQRIWRENLNLEQETERLAQAIRLFLQIKDTSYKNIKCREVRKNEEMCIV